MKEFLKTNTITYNLMSFTGFKSILIFSMLLEGEKTYDDLKNAIANHPYLQEKVSTDTLRIYINSLKKIGCEIIRKTKNHVTYYSIEKQPFDLQISEEQAQSILKIYKAISKSISVTDFISLQNFFEKFSKYINNQELKDKLKNISPIKNIKIELIKDLMKHVQSNNEITIYYNSPNSGKKNITILPDKMNINNGKLYIYGINSEYNNYSSFLVSKIIKIVSVNLNKSTLEVPTYIVKYELEKEDYNFATLDCEKIIDTTGDKYIVEIKSKNKFDIIQRIMSHTNKCKVLSPDSFKEEIITALKQMKEGYFEEQ